MHTMQIQFDPNSLTIELDPEFVLGSIVPVARQPSPQVAHASKIRECEAYRFLDLVQRVRRRRVILIVNKQCAVIRLATFYNSRLPIATRLRECELPVHPRDRFRSRRGPVD